MTSRHTEEIGARTPCVRCGKVWSKGSLLGHHYSERNGEVKCIDRRYCRARALHLTLGLDHDLFGKTPRKHWQHQMDVRPANWKEINWRPAFTEMERVEACIKYHSWCFPVCMEYACLLNQDDDNIVQRQHTDGPVPLRERDIVRILNMHQQNVNRAIKGLVARHKLTIDQNGRYCPNPSPAELTLEERHLLYRDKLTQIAGQFDKELRAIPRRYRRMVTDRLLQFEDDLRSDVIASLIARVCTPFNDGLRHLRTTRDSAIEEWCRADSIILFRGTEILTTTTEIAPPPRTATPAKPPCHEELQSASAISGMETNGGLEAAYQAGLGRGSLAKLPPQAVRQVLQQISQAVKVFVSDPDEPALRDIVRRCRTADPACKLDEILRAIADRGPYARTKGNPLGFLLTAVPNCFQGASSRVAAWRAEAAARHERDAKNAAQMERNTQWMEEESRKQIAAEQAFETLPEAEKAQRIRATDEQIRRKFPRWTPIDGEVELRNMAINELRRELYPDDAAT